MSDGFLIPTCNPMVHYRLRLLRSPCTQSCVLMIHPISIIQLGEVCSLMLVDIGVEASKY